MGRSDWAFGQIVLHTIESSALNLDANICCLWWAGAVLYTSLLRQFSSLQPKKVGKIWNASETTEHFLFIAGREQLSMECWPPRGSKSY